MSEKYPGSIYRLTGTSSRVIVYEDKVDIERNGFLNKLSYGFSGTKSIPMSSITSIQYKAAGSLFNGFLQFGVLGEEKIRLCSQKTRTIKPKRSKNLLKTKYMNAVIPLRAPA